MLAYVCRVPAWRTLIVVFATGLVFLLVGGTRATTSAIESPGLSFTPDLVVVLSGGVDAKGAPHCTVAARLRAAANISREHRGTALLMNGGGTSWKPRFVDKHGFAIPEAGLLAAALEAESGIGPLYLESLSDDTIGNALFARTLHTDLRPDWRDVVVVTSDFQLARAQAIFEWAFSLPPAPTGRPYRLAFRGVSDACLDPEVLRLRRVKEAESLASFSAGTARTVTTLSAAHEFIFRRHGAYNPHGVLSKAPLDSRLAETY